MRIQIALVFSFYCINVSANSEIDMQIKNSFLTLSAFECSAISPNDKETERLFLLGLNAGREFIMYAQSLGDSYGKDLGSRVAIVWGMTGGPTPDFILDQIYADRVDEVYKDYSTDKELWRIRREDMYREKNCSLIGK